MRIYALNERRKTERCQTRNSLDLETLGTRSIMSEISWDTDMKHIVVISTRWLANPHWGGSHFPHSFHSSYEYLIHFQSQHSHVH